MPADALIFRCPPVTAAVHFRASDVMTLMELPIGVTAHVHGIRPGERAESRELALRLLEIGFVEGEQVRVVAHGHPGREPLAVRIGGTTFALRRFEAERVLVEIESRHVAAASAAGPIPRRSLRLGGTAHSAKGVHS